MRFVRLIIAAGSIASLVGLGFLMKARSDGRFDAPLRTELDGMGAMTARGTLHFSTYSGSARTGARAPVLHRTIFINGPTYSGMEDNDLRGHLDGTFKYAWNQPTQVHVRIGRRDKGPRYGEFEIFRVLERWDGVRLPAGARVRNVRIRTHVERSAADTVAVMLYEMKKGWDPGTGGTLHDNVSPPNPGEVWWNDAAYLEASWGLPGAGYASDSDPNADTGEMPLAEAMVCPGCENFTFESNALAEYVERRARENQPLLFLLKVADAHEDMPGSVLNVYSGNHGDSRNIVRRPSLEIEWDATSEVASESREISLERGRALVFPRIPLNGARVIAASFIPDSTSFVPTIQYRVGTGEEAGMWLPFPGIAECEGSWVEMRLLAAQDPISLGEPFHAEIRDTWIRTAAPEEQKVPWVFTSPTGKRHRLMAKYAGDSRWVIAFVPDELGLWRYEWSQHFADPPYKSAIGYFDVLGGEIESLRKPLEKIAQEASSHDPEKLTTMTPLMVRFARVERAMMAQMTPDVYKSEVGQEVRAALRKTRAALSGSQVPDSLRMVPDAPPYWAQEAQKKKKK